jgi:zinc protease
VNAFLRAAAGALVAGIALAAQPAAAIDIQRVVSPGGIEAWLVSEKTLPMVTISFAWKGGSSQDPADKPGVANMLSGLLDEGAGDLDSQAFQGILAEKSIRISFDAGKDTFGGSFRALDVNRDEAVRLLKLSLNQPRFDAEPVERIRQQILAGIRSSEKDPDTIASQTWMKAAFPDHPYGKPTDGTIESVGKITVDELRSYKARVLARDNLKIAVVGSIDAAELGKLLDDVFGGLPAKASLAPVPNVKPVLGANISTEMAIPQTVIRFGGQGILRNDPDFIPAFIANHILGGGSFTSRLTNEVREKRGYAYSVGTGLAAFDHAGLFSGSTATRADRADAALALIESEIKRYAADGPTQQEVDDAKSYLIGSYALRFDSSGAIAGQLLGIQLDNLGIDYVNKRNDLVRAVTVEEVRKAARRIFGNGGLIVTRVGQKTG